MVFSDSYSYKSCVSHLNRHGNAERVYRLEFVSNQPFTDYEFAKWREAMLVGGLSLPSLFQVEKKVSALKQVSSYSYKESDIDEVSIAP